MSDLEDMNVMLGNFPRNDYENQTEERKIDVDPESDGLHGNKKPIGEDCRLNVKETR